MKEKGDNKGGRTPLPDEEKRKNFVATKLTDIELEVARAKAEAFKMTVYDKIGGVFRKWRKFLILCFPCVVRICVCRLFRVRNILSMV